MIKSLFHTIAVDFKRDYFSSLLEDMTIKPGSWIAFSWKGGNLQGSNYIAMAHREKHSICSPLCKNKTKHVCWGSSEFSGVQL